MIEIKNIRKSFKGTEVIKGISGEFQQGKVNMIIGASGTGKSVLLKCIVGLVTPDEGNVIYRGRDFFNSEKDVQREIRQEIGMLFQGGALFDSMTVEKNVMFPLDVLTKMPSDEKLDRVNFCLKRVGLENVNTKMPSEISGGMKKRVGIARAIVNNSKFLFCDEPNSGLDPQTSILIDELIKEITYEYDITTVVVSHDMNSVVESGDYILFMYQGNKLWEGTKDDILQNDVPELQDFIFANHILRRLKEKA
ncbi:ATP-binding cassette domain-containing protein [Mangrovivirga sp. M17]|uniref:ATP-binding cassette domain-containing protein n=1 Tax=Mangrovivirga halotolerans TaxID=2993936 RepID=A0ABT3RL62_9BACT|nr:ATP-binding cassette domain-containing protein [Mangrovivirga halotolerans]MCX2742568.1 ATP-binding cassette domain-containing protein [Mangrovivirga halotolerans]